MSEEYAPPEQVELPMPIGGRLRQARESKGLSIIEISEQTRVPRRFVEAIEAGRWTELPPGPYAVGFTRALSRAVGVSETEAAALARSEIASDPGMAAPPTPYSPYEPADSARVPPRRLAWTAAIIGILLIGGYGLWRSVQDLTPAAIGAEGETAEAPASEAAGAAAAAPAAPVAANAPLVIRATGDLWFGLNDPQTGRLVFQNTMTAGQSYAVPAEQRGLLLRTGRAQNMQLVLGDRTLPTIGPADLLVRDVALTAAALTARANGAAAAGPAAGQAAPTEGAAPATAGR